MDCDTGDGAVWYRAMMRSQRLKERHDLDYVRQREQSHRGKSMEEIEQMMLDSGEIPSSTSPESMAGTPVKNNPGAKATPVIPAGSKSKKRKLYTGSPEVQEGDIMPSEYRHVRESERIVKDSFYKTCANLSGNGMSVNESMTAVMEVANGMFGRDWKRATADQFDKDTLPEKIRVIQALRQIEAQSLSLVVQEIRKGADGGHMVTHASDSTTRRGVGQFIGQGIHIGKDSAYPLPLLGICGETKEDIATQLGMGLEILSAVSGVCVNDLAAQVDTLLTDSVEHNKGVNIILADMFDLDKPAGQIYCGTHTVLGFSNAMNQVVTAIEQKMKLDTILSKFMVSMELDSKNGSLAGQSLDMILKLIAPEFKHKAWNYHGLYTNYLEQRDLDLTLFSYKDHRFGCLSRAAAVLLNNYEHLAGFLSENLHISNKLTCLVRELMNLPHLKVIFAAFAAIGVHLIEPFYGRTIHTEVTHSQLKVFYKDLYKSLISDRVDEEFVIFSKPFFPGISQEFFSDVKVSYGEAVLTSVTEVCQEHLADVVMLINLMLPKLGETLARQRRDYGLDEEKFPAEFPVELQASNVDDTPTNNMDMERLMGKTDQRLQKLQTLPAASRSIILHRTQKLRDASCDKSYRSYRKQVELKRELEINWNKNMAVKFSDDAEKKKEVAIGKERKRILMLEDLKADKGPFTNAEEVKLFLADTTLSPKEKQVRMKKEVKFARDSSTTLPRVDPIFKIQVQEKLNSKKRRDKTAEEFGAALMAYLGKKEDRVVMEYSTFKKSLRDIVQ